MTLPFVFASSPAGNVPAVQLDQNYNAVGAMAVTQCTATGTNTVALAQNMNQPTVSAYANYLLFGFQAVATSTASITVNVNTLGALPLFLADGVTQAGNGSLVSGVYYVAAYNLSLNSGGGGFQLIGNNGPLNAVTLLSSQVISSTTPSVSVVDNIGALYSHYIWEIRNLTSITNAVAAYITVQQGGNFIGGTSYTASSLLISSGGVSSHFDNGVARFDVSAGGDPVSSSVPGTLRFEFWQPSLTQNLSCMFNGTFNSLYVNGGGTVGTSAATTGIKLAMSSGNIASCVANLYGIT